MLVVTLLAAIALPRWVGLGPSTHASANQLADDLRYAQSLAMSKGQRFRLNILTSTTYSITDLSSNAELHPVTGTTTVTLGTGISIGSTPALPNRLVAFDGQGAPYTNATATTLLASSATIPVQSSVQTCNIVITPTTGWISVICP